MNTVIVPHRFNGVVKVPSSKSHTIRRLLMASFTPDISIIEEPLDSLDVRSCITVCRQLGADIREEPSRLVTRGVASITTDQILDVGNSGTTLFLAAAMASLSDTPITLTGDAQIQRRSAENLLNALSMLGVEVHSNNGCAPITVSGPWRGGRCCVECPTSQYLSGLLLASSLAPHGTVTEIDVPILNEKPYIEMTLSYLDRQDVEYERASDFSHFRVKGGAVYKPMNGPTPADFSSAAFPAVAAVVSKGKVELKGLDPNDSQGDKAFFDILKTMGCNVSWRDSSLFVSRTGALHGGIFDLNAIPDALPAVSVIAAFARGETVLINIAHARIKETDRIAAMAQELGKLGVHCTERPDSLVIHGGIVRGGKVDGHGDHRIVMALAAAGLGAKSAVEVVGVEAADITYPGFLDILTR
ncbi:MAG: 3-phosphoshikimate 1-carboxyvinyltransferase [Treponema sp.]|jgi:3-phosphoshikimate 1-carboxyvinyltransferase|nr:3-phosphoshikimate 1-carboxyvinyltransferase [Treponema sp.]